MSQALPVPLGARDSVWHEPLLHAPASSHDRTQYEQLVPASTAPWQGRFTHCWPLPQSLPEVQAVAHALWLRIVYAAGEPLAVRHVPDVQLLSAKHGWPTWRIVGAVPTQPHSQ
jgi:hypothetical protein